MSEPHKVPVPLRWSDMDAYGHVNNVQFLRLLEDARVLGFRAWFEDWGAVLGEGIVVTRHAIEYHRPLTYRPAPVEVSLWVTRISGAGFDVGYVVADPPDVGNHTYAVAETGVVLYDFAEERPRRMAPEQKARLLDHLGGPVPFRWSGR